MAEKSKKGNPKLQAGKNRKLSLVTAKPLLLVVEVQHIHFLYIFFP
jgi:hypothetical protein